jgi:hypothetical protein
MVKAWRTSFTSSGGSSTSPIGGGLKKYNPIKDDGADDGKAIVKSSPRPSKKNITSVKNEKVEAKEVNRQGSDADSIVNEIQVEIQGLSLLEERDAALRQVRQTNKIVYFHALQLIRKQIYWLDLESGTNLAPKNLSVTQLQHQKKALEDLEVKIQRASFERSASLSSQKALFKATALLDDTVESLTMGKQQGSVKDREEAAIPDEQDRLLAAATLLEFYPENDSCSDVYCDSEAEVEEQIDDDEVFEKGSEQLEVRDSPVTDYDKWMRAFDKLARNNAEATEIADLVATESIVENNPFTGIEAMENSGEAPDILALNAIATTEDIPFSSDPFPDLNFGIKAEAPEQEDTTSKTETDTTGEFEASRIEI